MNNFDFTLKKNKSSNQLDSHETFDERLRGFTSFLFLSCNTTVNVESLADINFKVSEQKSCEITESIIPVQNLS